MKSEVIDVGIIQKMTSNGQSTDSKQLWLLEMKMDILELVKVNQNK